MSVLFIADRHCGRGHVMRSQSVIDDLTILGVDARMWDGTAPQIRGATVIVVDHYGMEYPKAVTHWPVLPVFWFDDGLVDLRLAWETVDEDDEPTAIIPIGDYAIVRHAIRRLKGTPKRFQSADLTIPLQLDSDDGCWTASFEMMLAQTRRVRCAAGVTAIEAAYLDCELDLVCAVENQRATYDWLMSGGRPDGLGSMRVAKMIAESVR